MVTTSVMEIATQEEEEENRDLMFCFQVKLRNENGCYCGCFGVMTRGVGGRRLNSTEKGMPTREGNRTKRSGRSLTRRRLERGEGKIEKMDPSLYGFCSGSGQGRRIGSGKKEYGSRSEFPGLFWAWVGSKRCPVCLVFLFQGVCLRCALVFCMSCVLCTQVFWSGTFSLWNFS
ncbi:hypothetical protein PIB30_049292 [Stylosanthes scabra]|uniref:Transmembrane protein n=1 Tax=Stylosanthes scabra TaxID=79078 RepID=A0ABU6QGL6_9FABA|nr:hypothetical protein [Stylosanthes scabra]